MQTKRLTATAIALVLAAGTAVAQQRSHDMKPMTQQMSDRMMSTPMTGNADVDFARMMREHHLGGIGMAHWEVEHGRDPKMKAMARKIIASQEKELRDFDKWLSTHGGRHGSEEMGGPPERRRK